jgi:hypothetical protein
MKTPECRGISPSIRRRWKKKDFPIKKRFGETAKLSIVCGYEIEPADHAKKYCGINEGPCPLESVA